MKHLIQDSILALFEVFTTPEQYFGNKKIQFIV